MSLDLYITSKKPIRRTGTGIYVRENGRNKELKTKEEVLFYFGEDTEVEVKVYETNEVWHRNMTHNLGKIARQVKGKERDLYTLFWRPTESIVTKEWVTEVLRCYTYLKEHEEELKPLEGDWGAFDLLKEFTESLIKCLLDLPYETEEYKIISSV